MRRVRTGASYSSVSPKRREHGGIEPNGIPLENAIMDASDALYRLEKRMLDRFPRDRVYVRAFFFDVGSKRKKKVDD